MQIRVTQRRVLQVVSIARLLIESSFDVSFLFDTKACCLFYINVKD